MHSFLRIFLCFLFYTSLAHLYGQGKSFSVRTSGEYRFRYVPEEKEQFSYSNLIIREIAADADKSLRHSGFALHYVINAKVIHDLNSRTFLMITFDQWECSGDIHYRGFDLSDVLIPAKFSGSLFFLNKNDSSFNIHVSLNDQIINQPDSNILTHEYYSSDLNPDTLVFSEPIFWFDNEAYLNFKQRIDLINDYYASSTILDTLLKVAGSIDFTSKSSLPLYFIHLGEINKMVKLIGRKDFANKLKLRQSDPRNLLAGYHDLYKFSLSSSMTFSELLEQPDSIRSFIPMDSLVDLFVSRMLRYIRWSLYGTWQNGKIYDEYLDTFFTSDAFDNDKIILEKLLLKMGPGRNPDSLMLGLSHQVKSAYLRAAEMLSNKNQFAEAVELLENQRAFLKSNPFLTGSLTENAVLSKAITGIYNSYLDVASMAIERGKLQLASNYLAKAKSYRQNNSALISSDSLVRVVTRQYYSGRMIECDRLAEEKNYLDAIGCYNDFTQTVDSFSMKLLRQDLDMKINMAKNGLLLEMLTEVKTCIKQKDNDSAVIIFDQALLLKNSLLKESEIDSITDSLYPVIDAFRYQQLLYDAQYKVQMRNFNRSYILLSKAKKIASMYQFKNDPLLDSLLKMTYPAFLADQLSFAESKIWTNHLNEAYQFADSIKNIQKNEGYADHSQLTAAIERYHDKIERRICWNARDSFDILQIRAWRILELKNFIKATSLLDSAIILARQRPGCLPEPGNLGDSIAKYKPAVTYLELMRKADRNASAGLFREAIDNYMEAIRSYEKSNVAGFGLEKVSLFDHVRARADWNFTRDALEYYCDNEDFSESFRYLELLRMQGFPKKDAKEIIVKLATAAAKFDFEKEDNRDPVILSKQYSEGDDWFYAFERSYIGEWNILKNEKKIMSNE